MMEFVDLSQSRQLTTELSCGQWWERKGNDPNTLMPCGGGKENGKLMNDTLLCHWPLVLVISKEIIMDEARVKEILGPDVFSKDGGLYDIRWYLSWNIDKKDATLDGRFTPDELEAIAWWMRHKFVT